jgi:chromosome segregation ATPase
MCQIITVKDVQDYQAQAERAESDLRAERLSLAALQMQLAAAKEGEHRYTATAQALQAEVQQCRGELEEAQGVIGQMEQEAKRMRQENMQAGKLQRMLKDKEERVGEQQARISELARDVVNLRESNEEYREKLMRMG